MQVFYILKVMSVCQPTTLVKNEWISTSLDQLESVFNAN